MSTRFWSENQVGGPYHSIEESAQALRERLRRYPTLLELMPVNHPGRNVLDFGCGPGHDTILLSQLGADVVYTDASWLALDITRDRLELHGLHAHRMIKPQDVVHLRFDHIHCAGVLHHTENPEEILGWFAQALLPDGEVRLMVYDGDASTHSQSEVPITRWWTQQDMTDLAAQAGFDHCSLLGGYECSADWRPNCMAACYSLRR